MINLTMDHVGWITNEVELFEKFWCESMGYHFVKEISINSNLSRQIFQFQSGGKIRRYHKENAGPDIEIHVFEKGSCQRPQVFQCFGINHICLHTGGPGSRIELIENIPEDIQVHTYNNPKGWTNMFLQDYEGNWIELREDL